MRTIHPSGRRVYEPEPAFVIGNFIVKKLVLCKDCKDGQYLDHVGLENESKVSFEKGCSAKQQGKVDIIFLSKNDRVEIEEEKRHRSGDHPCACNN